ncbi:hypothetical protein LCGC14_0568550, partial [marine sediment metagenome]
MAWTPTGLGDRITTLRRRWPLARVLFSALWTIAAVLAVAVVLAVIAGVATSVGG